MPGRLGLSDMVGVICYVQTTKHIVSINNVLVCLRFRESHNTLFYVYCQLLRNKTHVYTVYVV